MVLAEIPNFEGLYYITHVANLESILRLGILSHEKVRERSIPITKIFDEEIVSRRGRIITSSGKSLWHYANLYFQPRNPMLYRVTKEAGARPIAVIKVRREILDQSGLFHQDILVTDGNAASWGTLFHPIGTKVMTKIIRDVNLEFWLDVSDGKRKIMAECLVPERIPPEMIESIFVSDDQAAEQVKHQGSIIANQIRVIVDPNMFFLPTNRIQLTKYVTLIEGDMFNSDRQTLTVSVNTKGVMGKGLASQAKYLFPDVYVQYQDVCRQGKLKVGKPVLVKSRTSLRSALSDLVDDSSQQAWFLLFATKQDWRQKSRIEYVTSGLEYLIKHNKQWGIDSLALPALGCGLGGLEWEVVGPRMCQLLSKLEIPVSIYLPIGKHISSEYLSREYLLDE